MTAYQQNQENFWNGLGAWLSARSRIRKIERLLDDAAHERRISFWATVLLFITLVALGSLAFWWVIAHSVPAGN